MYVFRKMRILLFSGVTDRVLDIQRYSNMLKESGKENVLP